MPERTRGRAAESKRDRPPPKRARTDRPADQPTTDPPTGQPTDRPADQGAAPRARRAAESAPDAPDPKRARTDAPRDSAPPDPAPPGSTLTEHVQYAVINSAIESNGLVQPMIESYNCFVSEMLPLILEEHSEIVTRGRNQPVEHRISIVGTSVELPTVREHTGSVRRITHTEAQLRGLNYASPVCVDVQHTVHEVRPDGQLGRRESIEVWRSLRLCDLPTMVGSSLCCSTHGLGSDRECMMDPGGYFVFNGNQKCILSQEKLKTNTYYVFPGKAANKTPCMGEIRSCHEAKTRSTSTLYVNCVQKSAACVPVVTVTLPFIALQIPVAHMFVLLGCVTLDDMLDCTIGRQRDGRGVVSAATCAMAVAVIENSFDGLDADRVVAIVARGCSRHKTAESRLRYMEHIITHEVLPHVGISHTPDVLARKRLFLGLMIRKTAAVLTGERAPDDRDTCAAKRVDTPGMLLSLLFRQLMRKTVKVFVQQIHRQIDHGKAVSAPDIFKYAKITNGLRYAFGSGNWGTQARGPATQSGVVQNLIACNIVSLWAHMRRINTPINREGKAPKPRQLHSSNWRVVCPVETPEGASCGLVKNMALLCHMRHLCPVDVLASALLRYAGRWLVALDDPDVWGTHVAVHLNGTPHSFVAVEHAQAVLDEMLRARRLGAVPYDVSVYRVGAGELHVDSDAGCLMAPVLVVSELHRLPAILERHPPRGSAVMWAELVQAGVVQYLDNSEGDGYRVALRPEQLARPDGDEPFTHIEIHPSTAINGLCASIIPHSDRNQAPRNCYQSAMGKQAIAPYASNLADRMDVCSHVLENPMPPLVTTWVEDILQTDRLPAGQTVTVAIITYTGFNQEDSLIANQASIDRGMFRSTLFHTVRKVESTNGSEVERFERPDPDTCLVLKSGNYDTVDQHGMVQPGQRLSAGDCIIGQTMLMQEIHEDGKKPVRRDRSLFMRGHATQIVDKVLTSTTPDGHGYCKVGTREQRIPKIGDKFSSRHGQKGVIGQILRPEDMPFAEDGTIPDLIVNCHAFPSRMTIGHLIECLAGQLAARQGLRADGTPFRDTSRETLGDALAELGLSRHGTKRMQCGMTGEMMDCEIFCGPTFYQRLKHMADDKVHARSRGPIQIMVRQPVEGKARDGGLRYGEMERDTLISHGAPYMMLDRMLEQSDAYKVPICRPCGLIAQHPCLSQALVHRPRDAICRRCGGNDITFQVMCYPMKVLVQVHAI
jgi:DNA-directed RNA polymerase II subunit RPB2